MKLTAQQAAQFQRDGFLVFPQLFGPSSRPDWVVSRNVRALPVEADDAILTSAALDTAT